MASSTAIGSASVVLSANADGLTEGFEKAEQKTKGFASRIGSKLMNSGIGRAMFGTPEYDAVSGEYLGKIGGLANKAKGLLGASALGGPAGAVAGVVAAGIMKGFEVLGGLPDLIKGLAEGATGADAAPLRGLVAGMERFAEKGKALLGGFFASLAPGALAIGDVLMKGMSAAEPVIRGVGGALSRAFEFVAPLLTKGVEAAGMLADRIGTWLAPVVEKVSRAFDVVGYVIEAVLTEGVSLLSDILGGIGSVIDSVSAWAGEFFSVGTAFGTVEEIGFKCLRLLGQGAAYFFDSLKVGVGVVSYVGSFIADGLALVVDAFRSSIKDLLNIAGRLPDALGGAGFRRLAEGVDGWAGGIGAAAERMREWGASAITSWGDSAQAVDQWFDRLEGRFRGRSGAVAGMVEAIKPTESKLGGALLANSAEAYSVVTKFQTQNMVSAADPAREMIRKQDETNRLVRELIRTVTGIELVRTI